MTAIYTTAILAMSADGKLTDRSAAPSTFVSQQDQIHLEAQVAEVDAVIFGAGTLRAYGTTLSVRNPALLQARRDRQQQPQPLQIVCSRTADFDPSYRYFSQPIPRGLITTAAGAKRWQGRSDFEEILVTEMDESLSFEWQDVMGQLETRGIRKLALLGGGQLVASLLEAGYVDELWLTVCPILLGSTIAPVPVAGNGFLIANAPRLELLSMNAIESEVFLQYRIHRK